MIVINDVNSQKFSFNGIEYFKNFTPVVIGNKVRILNAYDSAIELTSNPTLFSDFVVDGNTFLTVAALQTALLPVLYTRSTLGGGGASAFTDLTDVPNAYTGQGGKVVSVKGTEDGLEFTTAASGGASNLIHYKIHWYNRTQTTGAGAVEFVDGFLAIPANTLQADDKIIIRTHFGDMDDSVTSFISEHVLSDQVRPIYNANGRIGTSSNNRRIGGFSREIRVVSDTETKQYNQGSVYFTDFYDDGIASTYDTQNGSFFQNLFTQDTYYNLYINCPNTRNYNVIFTEIYVYRNS